MAKQEESAIILKERSSEPSDKPLSEKIVVIKQQRDETGGSDERLTPANEYDIVIDSASRPGKNHV